jgi:hypothetical protein
MVAVLSTHSTMGSQRLAAAVAVPAAPSNVGRAETQVPAIAAGLAARADDAENATRRLAETVLALASDRDRLAERIALIERGLQDLTGSIRRQAAASLPSAPAASAPLAATPAGPVAEAPPLPQSRLQAAAAEASPPEPAARVAGVAATEASEPGPVAKVEFGIDVGGAANFDGLRALWLSTKQVSDELFDGLRPLVSAHENRSRGVDLRLVVGPLASTEVATRMCAALLAARRTCQMTTFEGSPLSLEAPEPERRPAAAAAPKRTPAPATAVAAPPRSPTAAPPLTSTTAAAPNTGNGKMQARPRPPVIAGP